MAEENETPETREKSAGTKHEEVKKKAEAIEEIGK